MCYELSSWFRRARAEDFEKLQRARRQTDEAKRASAAGKAAATEPERGREPAKEADNVPA